jgi:hypothetical protein
MKGNIHYSVISLLFLFSFCGSGKGNEEQQQEPPGPLVTENTMSKEKGKLQNFYEPVTYDVTPAVPQYTLPLVENDISNFKTVNNMLKLNENAAMLLKNGFVVVPYKNEKGENVEDIVEPYTVLSETSVPVFVTSDTFLHLYHIQFDEILMEIEETMFYSDIVSVTETLLANAEKLYGSSEGVLKESARRNVAFLRTARELLVVKDKPGTACKNPAPEYVAEVVGKELDLIEKHEGFSYSPLFIYKEDYSQYVPRGHYTRSELLKSYFRALMWYGRLTMLLKGGDPACEYDYCPALISHEDADVQTVGALLLTQDMNELKTGTDKIAATWEKMYLITAFFVGLSDDLTFYEYLDTIKKVIGDVVDINKFADQNVLFSIRSELARKHSPQIYGGTGGQVIWIDPGEEITPEMLEKLLDKSKGFRLMGQRFIPDSYIMGRLVSPGAGELSGSQDAFTAVLSEAGIWIRGFPRGLDVMALLGSARAKELLAELGDDAYTKYAESFSEMEKFLADQPPSQWYSNLYWGWLYSLKPLLGAKGKDTQSFMQTKEWQNKSLNAALASWSELRHDTILYAKQSYTPGFETSIEPPHPCGYVEPDPEFYARLYALNNMTVKGLESFGVLSLKAKDRLANLGKVLKRVLDISIVELENKDITEEDCNYIKYIGQSLESITVGVKDQGIKTTLVADVHTDQNSKKVLEEGVGYVDLIIAAYMLPDKTIALGVGPVLSYYEFKHPMNDRLTDEKWREMLGSSSAPDMPSWTYSYRTK